MTFDEWWNNWSVKDWNDIESAKNLFQQAFEAGLHADVHIDNSKVIADLEEKLANADYQLEGRDVTIKELEEQNTNLQEMLKAERSVTCKEEYLKRVTELEAHIEKMKCALNKIIKTVQNDNISGYGDRLVIIYDISCEVLQELEK